MCRFSCSSSSGWLARTLAAIAVAWCLLVAGGLASAAEPLPLRSAPVAEPAQSLPIKPGESQLWLMSTRTMPSQSACAGNSSLEVYYFPLCGRAIASSFDEFLATGDPQLVTVLFVHGNGVDPASAVTEGSRLFRELNKCGERPMRLVIWSWPSEHQQRGVLADLRLKLDRTNAESFYLAALVQALPGDAPLCMIGFSFGCRIVTGTLHLLGGGAINGQSLADVGPGRQSPIRTVLMAAAMGNDSLMAQGRAGRALSQTDRVMITINPRDRALRLFPLLREDRAPAMGLAGGVGLIGDVGDKLAHINVTSYLRHHHAFSRYLEVPEVLNMVRREVQTTGQSVGRSTPKVEVEKVGQIASPAPSSN